VRTLSKKYRLQLELSLTATTAEGAKQIAWNFLAMLKGSAFEGHLVSYSLDRNYKDTIYKPVAFWHK